MDTFCEIFVLAGAQSSENLKNAAMQAALVNAFFIYFFERL